MPERCRQHALPTPDRMHDRLPDRRHEMNNTHSIHAPVVLDIAGTRLNDDDRRRLEHPLTGGPVSYTHLRAHETTE